MTNKNYTDALIESYLEESEQLKEYSKNRGYADAFDQGRYWEIPDWWYQQELGYDSREDFLAHHAKRKELNNKINIWNKYYGQYWKDWQFDFTDEETQAINDFWEVFEDTGMIDSMYLHDRYDRWLEEAEKHMAKNGKVLFTKNDLFDVNGNLKYNRLKTIINMLYPKWNLRKTLEKILEAKEAGKIKNIDQNTIQTDEQDPQQSTISKGQAATVDYTDKQAANEFWNYAKKNIIDIDSFHKAFDDGLKAANFNMQLFGSNGLLSARNSYGAIKTLDDSKASVRALKKLWALIFTTNAHTKQQADEKAKQENNKKFREDVFKKVYHELKICNSKAADEILKIYDKNQYEVLRDSQLQETGEVKLGYYFQDYDMGDWWIAYKVMLDYNPFTKTVDEVVKDIVQKIEDNQAILMER